MNPFNGNRKALKSTVVYCWRCGKESKNLEASGEHQDAHNRGKVQPPVNEAKAKGAKKGKEGKNAKGGKKAKQMGKKKGKKGKW